MRCRGPRRALGELGLRSICLFPAMHHVPLDDDRTVRWCGWPPRHLAPPCSCTAACCRSGSRKKLGCRAGSISGWAIRWAWRSSRWSFRQVPFIIPHFGAGLLREALMAADTCANMYLDTSSSNSWIRYTPGPDARDRLPLGARRASGPSRLLFGTDSSFFPARLAEADVRRAAGGDRRPRAHRGGRGAHLRRQLRPPVPDEELTEILGGHGSHRRNEGTEDETEWPVDWPACEACPKAVM